MAIGEEHCRKWRQKVPRPPGRGVCGMIEEEHGGPCGWSEVASQMIPVGPCGHPVLGIPERDGPGIRDGWMGDVIFNKSFQSQYRKVKGWDFTVASQTWLHSKSPKRPAKDITAWSLPPETMIQ